MPTQIVADGLSYDAVPPEQVQMIDLFAGPGGLDVAARWLGITSVGIEVDQDACRTRVAAKIGTRHADVRDLSLLHEFPNARVLTGGPPCQTYSVAGAGSGRKALDRVLGFVSRMDVEVDVLDELDSLDDPRTGLVLQPLRWALEAIRAERPFRTILLEQVPTVRPVWDAMAEALEKRGYAVDVDVLRTEAFGVPQTRRRAILIARLDGAAMFPSETHRPYSKRVPREQGDPKLLPWETMGDALPERARPFVVVSNYGTGGNPRLRGRREWCEPSSTITGKVRRNRVVADGVDQERFTPAEAGRLQTFPLDYPWSGQDQYQQIGNAIPPRLGAYILAAAAFGMKPSRVDVDRAVEGSWRDAAEGEPFVGLDELDGRRGEYVGKVGALALWDDVFAESADVSDRALFDGADLKPRSIESVFENSSRTS
ncbi:DNA cytosine methyltransferase [Nocardia higoensis]|uniref:DNA cytosine methyltransferase n=1 Tax=Nocardia higoensis TaxID=228599 RepID=UPI000A0160A1|nr:DNA cytosine methyltransferase [Nocardia higoensis]